MSSLLAFICISNFFAFPSTGFSVELGINNQTVSVVQNFANGFCEKVQEGNDPELAARETIKSVIRGLISSGQLSKLMSAPKEDMSRLVSSEIYDQCGENIGLSKEELDDFVLRLAEGDANLSNPRPFKPFGIG